MFRTTLFKAALISFGGVFIIFAAERQLGPKKVVIKPRKTHEDIASKQKAKASVDGQAEVRREDVLRVAHRKERAKNGLMSRSAIISSAYDWTLVPKGAVLHVPPLYTKRVDSVRKGKLISWKDFYAKNRSWIRTVPVTMKQARGEDAISQEQLDSLKSAGQLLVAVCGGGPISVKEPPEQPEDPALVEEQAKKAEEKAQKEAKALEDLKRRLMKRR